MDIHRIKAGGEHAGHLGLPLTSSSSLIYGGRNWGSEKRNELDKVALSVVKLRLDSSLPSPVLPSLNSAYQRTWFVVVVCILNKFISIIWLQRFFLNHTACGILVPWPGIEPLPPAMEAWSLNHGKVEVLATQSCPTLCDPMDCSPPGSSVSGILQARILEWAAISFSRGSSRPRDWTWVSCIAGILSTAWATREDLNRWATREITLLIFFLIKKKFFKIFWCEPYFKSLLNLLQYCFFFLMFWFFGL